MIAGLLGGIVYVVAGVIAAIITGYLAPVLGLDPHRFVQRISCSPYHDSPDRSNILIRAHQEAWALFKRLIGVVLFSGLLPGFWLISI